MDIKQDIWGSTAFGTGAVVFGKTGYLFRDVKGTGSITLLDTNVTSASRIPYDKVFVYGVNVEVYGDGNVGIVPGLDMNAALNNMSVMISKNNLPILPHTMLSMIPAGSGISGQIDTGVATTTIINANNGMPLRSNYYPLKNVETFVQSDLLDGEVKVQSAGWTIATAFRVRVILLGYSQFSIS